MQLLLFFSFHLFLISLNIPDNDEYERVFTREYFPLDTKRILFYESSFGELISRVDKSGDDLLLSNTSDDFRYAQNFRVRNDSIFLTLTEQAVEVFLFISTESVVTYNEPALRIPFPLKSGDEWIWRGFDIHEGDTNRISFIGKAVGQEKIKTAAGEFECLKLEIKVESLTGTNSTINEWLAPDVGIVKEVVTIEGGGLTGVFRDILGYDEIFFELSRIESYYDDAPE